MWPSTLGVVGIGVVDPGAPDLGDLRGVGRLRLEEVADLEDLGTTKSA